jgi:AAA domain
VSATRCLSCGVELLDRDHLEWCESRVRPREEPNPAMTDEEVLAMGYERDETGAWHRAAPNGESVEISDIVVRLDDVQPECPEWLWPGRLPLGKLVILDGDPGTGKSTLAMDLAARLTTGSPMPDGAALSGPANVVALTAEDGLADTVRPRLDAARGNPANVHVLQAIREPDGTERPPRIPDDLGRLSSVVHRVSARFVIVDVLAAYLSGHVDPYRDADVRRALHPLAQLAEDTGAVILVLRHLSKSGGTNPLYRGGGSIGIIAAARVGLLAATDPDDDDRRVLAVTKSNLAAIPPALGYRLVPDEEHDCARIDWLGATKHQARDLLVLQDGEHAEQAEGVEWLIDFLENEGGSMPARDVKLAAREAGIPERTLDRVRQRAGVSTHRDGFGPGQGWTWSLRSRHDAPRSRHTRQPSECGENGENGQTDGENESVDLGARVSQSDLDELPET